MYDVNEPENIATKDSLSAKKGYAGWMALMGLSILGIGFYKKKNV